MADTIDVAGVSHRFGARVALDDVSLGFDTGVCALLGPNGAGKTTLMRLLATIYPVQTGEIRIDEHNLGTGGGRSRASTLTGYVPQAFSFYPNFSVAEFVEYFALLRGVARRELRERIQVALANVDLADRADSKLKALSGGMLRRAGIAQALVHDPSVLLLDEPTAGLDPEQRHELRRLVADLAKAKTVLVSTHLTEDIAAIGGRVVVLGDGSVRFDGPAVELASIGGDATAASDLRTSLERGYSRVQAAVAA